MNFEIPPKLQDLRDCVRTFVIDQIIPLEPRIKAMPHGPTDEFRQELVALARQHGFLTPHAPREFGGMGLTHSEKAVIFEAAGYSPLGPIALNIAAPDEGNIHLLAHAASAAQNERWLRPLVAGDTRSVFCMTEPDGAGSDPSLMQTTAVRDGDDFVINGRKWLITGAEGASFAIIMAKTTDDRGTGSATMFMADWSSPGIVVERLMDSLDQSFTGGHGVVRFENLRIPASDVLGEVGEGFRYAQIRLAPARLTHCMRWLGAAQRAHDIAAGHAIRRRAFGKPLIEHEGVGFMLADNEIELRMARLAIWHTAWLMDQGLRAGTDSSMAKVFCSEALWRVADRSLQVLGGIGLTGETVVEWIFRELRGFRIYDGPSEVHRWSIAKHVARTAARAPAEQLQTVGQA